jgi:MYXO-CTERM domain-containing protein
MERDGSTPGPDAGEMQPAPSGCGCAVDPGQSPSGLALMLVAGGVVFSRRRRR